jgi:RND family efflux transporter MFP subunit
VKQYKTVFFLTAALALAAAAAWWWWFGRGPEVTAVVATRGTAAEIVYATGAVEPVRWAKVSSLIRDRIVEICDCEGRAVKKGEVLARLDDSDLRAQLRELKAREEFAKREMERVNELVSRGVATRQAFERASSDLQQIQALVTMQEERLADYVIVAPMDGIVLRRDGEVGEVVEAGQVLFRVGAPKPLRVIAEVNEEDIPRVKVGQTALLRTDAFPGQRLQGTVTEITPMGDVVTKTYRIRIALPDDSPLLPGMSVEANVIAREKTGALLVPADALRGTAVFVIDGRRVHRREVMVGIRGTRLVEILSGLKEGERVASPATAELADGARVRITAERPAVP